MFNTRADQSDWLERAVRAYLQLLKAEARQLHAMRAWRQSWIVAAMLVCDGHETRWAGGRKCRLDERTIYSKRGKQAVVRIDRTSESERSGDDGHGKLQLWKYAVFIRLIGLVVLPYFGLQV
jgi:hypothetical protein